MLSIYNNTRVKAFVPSKLNFFKDVFNFSMNSIANMLSPTIYGSIIMQCPMAIFVTIISMAIDKNNKSGVANSKNCYSAILFCIISKRGGTSFK